MQELDDEYCEVLESVRIDCHRHGLNAGLGPKLDLDILTNERRVFRSRDLSRPIIGQCLDHVT